MVIKVMSATEEFAEVRKANLYFLSESISDIRSNLWETWEEKLKMNGDDAEVWQQINKMLNDGAIQKMFVAVFLQSINDEWSEQILRELENDSTPINIGRKEYIGMVTTAGDVVLQTTVGRAAQVLSARIPLRYHRGITVLPSQDSANQSSAKGFSEGSKPQSKSSFWRKFFN